MQLCLSRAVQRLIICQPVRSQWIVICNKGVISPPRLYTPTIRYTSYIYVYICICIYIYVCVCVCTLQPANVLHWIVLSVSGYWGLHIEGLERVLDASRGKQEVQGLLLVSEIGRWLSVAIVLGCQQTKQPWFQREKDGEEVGKGQGCR